MIWECLEIFENELKKKGDSFVLDKYLPKDGTYFTVEMQENNWKLSDPIDIVYDKKSQEIQGRMNIHYSRLCFLDYYSKLIDMNKPMDTKKIVHSNNYLSFAVKKESLFNGKLTDDIIDGYYKIFANLNLKYSKQAGSKKLYQQVEEIYGTVNLELMDKIQVWVKEHIFEIIENTKKKDYLKLFFIFPDWEQTKEVFIQEANRYLIPSIYNNNKYNIEINGKIYGLPNDNLQMNEKKPYLGNRTRKISVPFLLDRDQVLLQAKFYDCLSGFAAKGKYNIYFDIEENKIQAYENGKSPEANLCGYYIRLKKGKEVEIHNVDTIICYNPNMKERFYYKQILKVEADEPFGPVITVKGLEDRINQILFNKALVPNYFTNPEDISLKDSVLVQQIVAIRERLFTYFYKNTSMDISSILITSAWKLIQNSFLKGNWKKARQQLNLKWSLEDYYNRNRAKEILMSDMEKNMFQYIKSEKQEWDFKNDEEYYFGIGQMVSFLIGKSRAAKRPLSLINPYLNAADDKIIKEKLRILFQKYSYDISYGDGRVKTLLSHLMLYKPEGKVNKEMIIAGATAANVFYKKEEK